MIEKFAIPNETRRLLLILCAVAVLMILAQSPTLHIDLPSERNERTSAEIIRQTPFGNISQRGDQFTASFSPDPVQFQTATGEWQRYQPAFRFDGEHYMVEANTLQSRLGKDAAWLSTAADGAVIHWQTERFGFATERAFVELATVVAGVATKSAETTLTYTNGWSDPTLSEAYLSTNDHIEHVLIVSQPPDVTASAHAIELQATLRLLPGNTIWANGAAHASAFQTDGALEIRNAAGEPAIIFDPIVAFEQADPDQRIAGSYTLTPQADDEWHVQIRTPHNWWLAPERVYPVVLDPTMHIAKSTGYGNGMAWVGNDPDLGNEPYHFGEIKLGTYPGYAGNPPNHPFIQPYEGYNAQANGYVQFNSLPGLAQNSPAKIAKATLIVEPLLTFMPKYENSALSIDWEEKEIATDLRVNYVGACPAQCLTWSLQDDRLTDSNTYSWNNRPLNPFSFPVHEKWFNTEPLKGGTGKTYPVEFDVTAEISNFYNNFYTDGDRPKPTFRLSLVNQCDQFGNFFGENALAIPFCLIYRIPTGNVRLDIEYETVPLGSDTFLLNKPGVPGYAEGVFEDTAHSHDIGIASFTNWHAVAVRGNHEFDFPPLNKPPARVDMIIGEQASGFTPLLNATTTGAGQTAVAFIDNHSATNIKVAELRAQVLGSNANGLADDPDRDYGIEHREAADVSFGYGKHTVVSGVSLFPSTRLVRMWEFNLDAGDNILLTADIPAELEPFLIQPTNATNNAGAVIGMSDFRVNTFGDETLRTLEISSIATSGTWLLALVNQAAPTYDGDPDGTPDNYDLDIEITRCPVGTIATVKYECQPLFFPDGSTPRKTHNGLTIYSEEGFVEQDGDWCTEDNYPPTIPPAPIIGPSQDNRYIYVAQGQVCLVDGELTTTEESAVGLTAPTGATNASGQELGHYAPGHVFGSAAFFPLPAGQPHGIVEVGGSNRIVPSADNNTRLNRLPLKAYWQDHHTNSTLYINPLTMQAGMDSATLAPDISLDVDLAPLTPSYTLQWLIWPQHASQFDGDLPRYEFIDQIAQQQLFANVLAFGNMQLRLLSPANDTINSRLTQVHSIKTASGANTYLLRAPYARLTHDASLGSASKTIEVVVSPPGFPLMPLDENGSKSCAYQGSTTSCLDIRDAGYAWDNGEGEKVVQAWQLPDIHIADTMGTLAISSPGRLSVFSDDHPNAIQAVDNSFSFDTWGATVSVTQETCDDGGAVTTVIKGNGRIALPAIGDAGGGGIEVAFKLCEIVDEVQLRRAQLTFETPVPVPVGSTGLGVTLIGGTIDVGPNSTRITLELEFETLDGTTLTKGHGALTIDTAGLFELQADGKFLGGILHAELLLQVSWSPFDMLFKGEVACCGNLLTGGMQIHAWVGQGWQNKYHWLPDDDAFHFTGIIWAKLSIDSGEVVDFPLLPPFDFSIEVTVAFGEFCENSSCSQTEWGVSVTIGIAGTEVGVFVGESGPAFILGTNGNKLIDQHGGSRRVVVDERRSAQSSNLYQYFPPGYFQPTLLHSIIDTPVDDWPVEDATTECSGTATRTHTCNFSVGAGAGRALFFAGWQNGTLDVSLRRPDGVIIDASNAVTYNTVYSATFSSGQAAVSMAVWAEPDSALQTGTWQLILEGVNVGLPVGSESNYRLLFASDPPAPTLTWNAPQTDVSPDGNGDVTLSWNATRAGQPLGNDVLMELFYVPTAQQPITPTVISGTLLANAIQANSGSYTWNVGHLAEGSYAVAARIDDSHNANAHIVSWAPGTVTFSDNTPPPVPSLAGDTTLANGGLLLTWFADLTSADLAGYLVEYTIPDWTSNNPPLTLTRRVHPGFSWWMPSLFERVRLNGLQNGVDTTVCVRAYDASGNVSGCTPTVLPVASRPGGSLGVVQNMAAIKQNVELIVDWDAPTRGTPDGYMLTYQPTGCETPLTTSGLHSLHFDGTTPPANVPIAHMAIGQRYEVAVWAYDDDGVTSAIVEQTFNFWDEIDSDIDFMVDQWEQAYNITSASADPDEDGLTNLQEFQKKTNPLMADSDGDGFYDVEEDAAGTDPCAPERPTQHECPLLGLSGDAAVLFRVPVNAVRTPSKAYKVFGLNSAEKPAWSASSHQGFISVVSDDSGNVGDFSIAPNLTGFAVGTYMGEVRVEATCSLSSGKSFTERVIIPVTVEITPEQTVVPTQITLTQQAIAQPLAMWAIVLLVGVMAGITRVVYRRDLTTRQ